MVLHRILNVSLNFIGRGITEPTLNIFDDEESTSVKCNSASSS